MFFTRSKMPIDMPTANPIVLWVPYQVSNGGLDEVPDGGPNEGLDGGLDLSNM